MNIDMMVFGEDWGSHPSSTQHLIRQWLPKQDILWINSLGLRRPKITTHDAKRAFNKLSRMLSTDQRANRAVAIDSTPMVVNPHAISWPGNPLVRKLNKTLLTQQLRPFLQNSSTAPILWTSLPSAVDLVGNLGERAAVYYCGDDFSALDGVDHKPVTYMENELAEKVQLIITASDKLAAKFPQEKTVVLPHGVDYELFSTPTVRASDLPSSPVAGFYGALAGWFNQPLMIEVAKRLPHWTFVLIGPAHTDISPLLKQPNIRWLGPKPHHALPHYSQHWDVGLLPFLNNAQIEACNPLKLREYLAAGKPIVSTDFPALDGYRDQISVAQHAIDFALQIENSLTNQNFLTRKARQQSVANESWQHKAAQLHDILQQL